MSTLSIRCLSFVEIRDGVTDFWVKPSRSLSWSEANNLGKERADELITYCRLAKDPCAFSSVVQSMAGNPEPDGVAVGFLMAIGQRLTA